MTFLINFNKILSIFLFLSTITLLVINYCLCASVNTRSVYRIENAADGLHLTIQNVNNSFAAVVGENWFGYGEQRWRLKIIDTTTGSYQLLPETYRSNNRLSYYVIPNKKYPQIQTWLLKKAGNQNASEPIFQVVNNVSKLCLTSLGRRNEVGETKCDIYQRNQKWNFQETF